MAKLKIENFKIKRSKVKKSENSYSNEDLSTNKESKARINVSVQRISKKSILSNNDCNGQKTFFKGASSFAGQMLSSVKIRNQDQ